jgi:hypothetical protein
MRKARQRKKRKQRKNNVKEQTRLSTIADLTKKLINIEKEHANAKKIANGYFHKWVKANEEKNIFSKLSPPACRVSDIPCNMLLDKENIEILNDVVIGEGTFGKCVTGTFK